MSYRIRKIIKSFEEGNPPTDRGYLIISGSFFTNPVWYRENNRLNQWEWTVDLVYWYPLDITIVQNGISKGERLSEDNLYFVSYLKNKYLKEVLENCGMNYTSMDCYKGISNNVDNMINQYNTLGEKNTRTRSEYINKLNEMVKLREDIYKLLLDSYIINESNIINELEVNAGDNPKYFNQIILGTIRNWKKKFNEISMVDNARIHLINEKNRVLNLLQNAQSKNIILENELRAKEQQIEMLTSQLKQNNESYDYEII